MTARRSTLSWIGPKGSACLPRALRAEARPVISCLTSAAEHASIQIQASCRRDRASSSGNVPRPPAPPPPLPDPRAPWFRYLVVCWLVALARGTLIFLGRVRFRWAPCPELLEICTFLVGSSRRKGFWAIISVVLVADLKRCLGFWRSIKIYYCLGRVRVFLYWRPVAWDAACHRELQQNCARRG
jgi:hypothetical protein